MTTAWPTTVRNPTDARCDDDQDEMRAPTGIAIHTRVGSVSRNVGALSRNHFAIGSTTKRPRQATPPMIEPLPTDTLERADPHERADRRVRAHSAERCERERPTEKHDRQGRAEEHERSLGVGNGEVHAHHAHREHEHDQPRP